MSCKGKVLKREPNAFCQPGTWGGWTVWLRGSMPKPIGHGGSPAQAWSVAARKLRIK